MNKFLQYLYNYKDICDEFNVNDDSLNYLIKEFEQPCYGVPRHKDWPKERDNFIATKQKVCQVCGTNKDLTVHHSLPYHLYPSLEMDTKYWITMCERPFVNCHFFIGHLGDWRAYNPTVFQDSKFWMKKIEKRLYK